MQSKSILIALVLLAANSQAAPIDSATVNAHMIDDTVLSRDFSGPSYMEDDLSRRIIDDTVLSRDFSGPSYMKDDLSRRVDGPAAAENA
jgi:hypothetical protein